MLRKMVATAAIAVTAGALSFGAAGLAGAAPASPTTQTAGNAKPRSSPVPKVPKVGKNFNCANATKVLTRIQSAEARIAAGLPKLTAAEAKAQAAGNTTRATRLQTWITRLESPTLKAKLDQAAQKIEAKCQVAAPTTPAA